MGKHRANHAGANRPRATGLSLPRGAVAGATSCYLRRMENPYEAPRAGEGRPPRPRSARDAGLVAVAHLATMGLASAVIVRLGVGTPGLSAVFGAIVGTQLAVYLHVRRTKAPAATGTKLATGALLATLAVGGGVALQALTHVIVFPEVVIPIWAVGSLVFPFVLWGTLERAFLKAPPKAPPG